MKKLFKSIICTMFMVLCLAMAPASALLPGNTGAITAEAATETAVKALTKGKTYTVNGYAKVTSSKTTVATATKKSSTKYTITGVKKGRTTLKCYNSSGKLVKKIYLIVVTSSSYKYDTSDLTLTVGQKKTVEATAQTGVTIKYSSSDKTVAKVSSSGVITAKGTGTVTISANFYYKDVKIKTLKKNVTVKTDVTNYSSVASYDSSEVIITVSEDLKAVATVPSGYSVEYSSADTNIALYSFSGIIRARGVGTTTVTAKVYYEGSLVETLTKKVTVEEPTVTYDTSPITISPGKTKTVSLGLNSLFKVSYSSSDTAVATVSSSGVITGVSAGTAIITMKISYEGKIVKTLTQTVTVGEISLSENSLTLYCDAENNTAALQCLNNGKIADDAFCVWYSSDTSIVTVTNDATAETILTPKGIGSAIVTLYANGIVKLECKITVTTKYSYDLYLVGAEQVYDGCSYCLYLKTTNPSISTHCIQASQGGVYGTVYINNTGSSSVTGANFTYSSYPSSYANYADLLLDTLPSNSRLYKCNFKQSGTNTIYIRINGVVVKTFDIYVLDYDSAEEKWIDSLISNYTATGMNSFEKMESICKYLTSSAAGFRYPANDGTNLVGLTTQNGPYFVTKVWDSDTSPAALAKIAERVGGFDTINDMYDDYTRGTTEWQRFHYYCELIIGDTARYYAVCPSSSTGLINTLNISYVDFTTTNGLTHLG